MAQMTSLPDAVAKITKLPRVPTAAVPAHKPSAKPGTFANKTTRRAMALKNINRVKRGG
jgi:hypothetical protein